MLEKTLVWSLVNTFYLVYIYIFFFSTGNSKRVNSQKTFSKVEFLFPKEFSSDLRKEFWRKDFIFLHLFTHW